MDFVADNSFYSCFLNDIDESYVLIAYLDSFKHHIGPKIKEELSKSSNYNKIKNHRNLNYFPKSQLNISSIVEPLFSSEEKHQGEQEVIAVAYMTYCINQDLIVVIDEKGPRNIVLNNVQCLKPFLKGTIGLIVDSVKKYKILNKNHAVTLLDKIEKSKFRVTKQENLIQILIIMKNKTQTILCQKRRMLL